MSSQDKELHEAREVAFAVAYRMLGSVSDAEDIVQDTLLRRHQALESGEVIRSPRAYVTTIATRLALTSLTSARRRREHYVGEWLPEPLATDPAGDPEAEAELADSLSLAYLTLLESLTPAQRAALLLHDVFGYPHAEIARILRCTPAAARQLLVRARRQLEDSRPRFTSTPAERAALAERFLAAARDGDLPALESLLAEDVELHGDGGGKVPALARAIHGRQRVARTLLAWARAGGPDVQMQQVEVGAEPALLTRDADGRVLNLMAIEAGPHQIHTIRSIVNPDKLAHLGDPGSLDEFIRGRGTK